MAPLRLLWFLLSLVFFPIRLPLWLLGRRIPRGVYVHLEVNGSVVELQALPMWFRRRAFTLHALRKLRDAVVKDDRVKGIILTIRSIHAGMATATALREMLASFREAGKEVVVHLPLGAGTKEFFVATGASRILMGPRSMLAPVGFAVSSRYFGKALSRLGIEPKVLHRGEYKSAGETLVRDSMSEPQRKQLEELLDQMYAALLHAVSAGRGMTREKAQELVDKSPHRPQAAVDAGLIDGCAYEDEIPALLASRERPAKVIPASRYARAMRPLLAWPKRRSLCAVVQVHGPIVSSSSASPGIASDDNVIAAIRMARAARSVRAVILHVDSPGGSALASDRIHHELMQLAAEKPLVACLANVAASGGYYVAAASSHLIAEPTTITGSIGVVAARFVIQPLLDKWGITTETVKRGARAGLLDPFKPLDDDELAAIDGEIGATYDAFIDVVAQGRGKPREEILELAQGRVWSGADAHARGLVDELGGFETAVRYASARAGRDLEPVLIRSFRSRIPPLAPPSPGRALLDLFTGERVLAISDVATWLLKP